MNETHKLHRIGPPKDSRKDETANLELTIETRRVNERPRSASAESKTDNGTQRTDPKFGAMSEAHVTDAHVNRAGGGGEGRGAGGGGGGSPAAVFADRGAVGRGRSLSGAPRSRPGEQALERQPSRHPSPVTLAGLRGRRGPQRAVRGLLPALSSRAPFRSSPTALDTVRLPKLPAMKVRWLNSCVRVRFGD